jgi:peptidyl-prolyl cis-trans isomerase C
MKKWLATRSARILVALGVIIAGAGLGAVVLWPSDDLPAGSAFRADGQTVSVAQLQAWTASMKALYGVQVPTSTAQQDTFWRAAAKAMATERVVAQAAQRSGVSVPSARANAALTQYVVSVYGAGATGQSAFASALMTAGTSLPAVQAEFRRVLIDEALFAKVTGKASTPTTAQLEAGYTRWSCHLGTAETRHIQNIVVLDAATAATVKRELAAGTSWNSAVSRWSQDSSSVAEHGDIGWQTAASLQPAFAKVAFAAAPGVTFGPVQTSAGYDIGRVLAIRPATAPSLAASAAQVDQWLQAEQETRRWSVWIAKQTAAADVRYAATYRPNAKTTAVAASSPLGSAVPANCPAK